MAAPSKFPSLLNGYCFKHPLTGGPRLNTKVYRFLDDTEQRFAQMVPLAYFNLTWNSISRTDLDILYNFFCACKGAYEKQWGITIPIIEEPELQITSMAGIPNVLTVTGHPYNTDDWVLVSHCIGAPDANGGWKVTDNGSNTFTLVDSTGDVSGYVGNTGRVRKAAHYDYCAFASDDFTYTEVKPQRYTVTLQIGQVRRNA